jgi:hypothetical protein
MSLMRMGIARFTKTAQDQITGGKADGMPSSSFPADQLRMGKQVEMEHTDDPAKAEEIARDHLEEFGDYYTALKAMEEKLKEEGGEEEGEEGGEEEGEEEEGENSGKTISEEALMQFFASNPHPTDEQVHELAEAYKADKHAVEAQIYAMLGDRLGQAKTAAFFDELGKIAQGAGSETGDDEDKLHAGKQVDATPALLQPDDGPGSGFREPVETFSSAAERLHKQNREDGLLPDAFAHFDEAARQSGKTLGETYDGYGKDSISSSAQTNRAQEKVSAARREALVSELRKYTRR